MENVNGQAAVMELDANAVQAVLEAGTPQTATVAYAFTVSLFERFGRTFISWQLDPTWAIGAQDVVQLREDNQFIGNWDIKATSGELDTGRDWGSSLNASYWSWSYGSSSWRQLVVTPNT